MSKENQDVYTEIIKMFSTKAVKTWAIVILSVIVWVYLLYAISWYVDFYWGHTTNRVSVFGAELEK